ncbi:MAG: hypothetical protein PVJ57_17365 [Phycisphaerae bacterium]|jgi:hypothetical protein
MWKRLASLRCLAGSLSLLAIGGCFTGAQLGDFARTEFARLTADFVGQLLSTFVQSASTFSVQ